MQAIKAGYGRQWGKARAKYLAEHPYCVMCHELGKTVEAQIVDHIKPHRGDSFLFWYEGNWQALCKSCHDRYKQKYEKTGIMVGVSRNGIPLSKAHHWRNK